MGKQKQSQETKEGGKSVTEREGDQEKLRELAYQLFCECGYEHGHDLEHWLEAERRVLGGSKGGL